MQLGSGASGFISWASGFGRVFDGRGDGCGRFTGGGSGCGGGIDTAVVDRVPPVPVPEDLDDPLAELAEPTVVDLPAVGPDVGGVLGADGVLVSPVDGEWRRGVVDPVAGSAAVRPGWSVGSAAVVVGGGSARAVGALPVVVGAAGAGVEVRGQVLDVGLARDVSPFGAAVAVDMRLSERGHVPALAVRRPVVEVTFDLSDVDLGAAMIHERLRVTAFGDCTASEIAYSLSGSLGVGSEELLGRREQMSCPTRLDMPVVGVDLSAGTVTALVDFDAVEAESSLASVRVTAVPAGRPVVDSGVEVREVGAPRVVGVSTPWPGGVAPSGTRGSALGAVTPSATGGVVLALTSAASGASGDYGAIPVPTLGSADVGAFSGSAEYSYPIAVPAAAAGPQPSVGLIYSAGSIDGLNTESNAQAGPVGVGWSLAAGGSIVREWGSCGEFESSSWWPDTELCDAGDRYVLSLNGLSSRLIETSTADEFRLEDDPYWRVRRKFSGASASPDGEGEWWEVTTRDGTVHEFGRDGGRDSVATAWVWDETICAGYVWWPVCEKGWSWNLDEVRDTNGNEVRYFYTPEYNHYSMGLDTGQAPLRAAYVQALQLDRIEYTHGSGQVEANARVMFRWETRCGDASTTFGDCGGLLPDTPTDLWCGHQALMASCGQGAQTFWSAARLGSIQTQVNQGGGVWFTEASYDLAQSFPTPPVDSNGDTSEAKLALFRIHRRPQFAGDYLAIDQIEAEDFSSGSGVYPVDGATLGLIGGDTLVASLHPADWFKISGVDFGSAGSAPDEIRVRYSSPHASVIEILRDSISGPVLATLSLPSTGGWATWATTNVALSNVSTTGVHDVVVRGVSSTSGLATANIDWIRFAAENQFNNWASLPPTDFYASGAWAWLDNRVNHPGGVSPMTVARIQEIDTGIGGLTSFTYQPEDPACVTKNSGWDNNHLHCYPGYDSFTGGGGWVNWNKHVVSTIEVDDGWNPTVTSTYTYENPSWAYNDTLSTQDTWNDFRGHRRVTIETGNAAGSHSTTDMFFLQGMYEDHLVGGALKYETVTRSDGLVINDHDWWIGKPYETKTLDANGQPITASWNWYADTITAGSGTDSARFTGIESVRQTTYAASGDKVVDTDYLYDPYGNVKRITELGDLSTTNDNRETQINYVRNTALWIVSTPCQSRTWDDDNGGSRTNDEMVTRARWAYDGHGYSCKDSSNPPTKGNVTRNRDYTTWSAFNTTDYTVDSQGRTTVVGDPRGNTTTTAFDPLHGDVAQITNDAGHVTAQTYDDYRRPTLSTGPNVGQQSSVVYDAYGRVYVTENPLQRQNPSAYDVFVYNLAPASGPSSVTNWVWVDDIGGTGSFDVVVTYVDGFGRPIQIQSANETGGRFVTAADRDERGLPYRAAGIFAHSGEPGAGFLNIDWNAIESQTRTLYDDAARPTNAQLRTHNSTQTGTDLHSQTTLSYDGWVVTTTNPKNYSRRETVDAYGGLLLAETGTSFAEDTAYEYDAAGRLVGVTDDAGNQTSIGYNLTGWKTSLNDPSTGTWSYAYDEVGNLVTQTDNSNSVLFNKYDGLNRLTEQRVTNSTGLFCV